eukprot:m.74922 g.74922  ORF g.74922 m.74922 type:complete len:156 (+) comp12421_c0_seq1:314-781(+)
MAPKAIIVCVDESEAAHDALEWAINNMYHDGDCLHLTHCFKPLQPAVGPHYAYVPTEEEQANWRKEKAHVLEEFMSKAKAMKADIHAKSVLVAGDPREELIHYGERENATVIILGSRGRGAIKRAVLGSVSSHLVHHSDIPVVVIHHKKGQEASS